MLINIIYANISIPKSKSAHDQVRTVNRMNRQVDFSDGLNQTLNVN